MMKTRHDDMRTAVQEALEMLHDGRPSDAMETLESALEAPTSDVSARDAALEEAAQYHDRKGDEARKWLDEQEQRAKPNVVASWRVALQTHRSSAVDIRALQSAPARVVSVEKVREVLLAMQREPESIHWHAGAEALARRLGVDLEAAPAKEGSR